MLAMISDGADAGYFITPFEIPKNTGEDGGLGVEDSDIARMDWN